MINVPAMLKPQIERNIAMSGQHLMGIFPTVNDQTSMVSFIYTVGMHQQGYPEFILIGDIDPRAVSILLNALCDTVRKEDGTDVDEGMIDVGHGVQVPLKLRNCGRRVREEYTIQAGQFYGTQDYKVMQVLICDKHGIYQDDRNCAYGLVDLP